jgi:hypothetical protein
MVEAIKDKTQNISNLEEIFTNKLDEDKELNRRRKDNSNLNQQSGDVLTDEYESSKTISKNLLIGLIKLGNSLKNKDSKISSSSHQISESNIQMNQNENDKFVANFMDMTESNYLLEMYKMS